MNQMKYIDPFIRMRCSYFSQNHFLWAKFIIKIYKKKQDIPYVCVCVAYWAMAIVSVLVSRKKRKKFFHMKKWNISKWKKGVTFKCLCVPKKKKKNSRIKITSFSTCMDGYNYKAKQNSDSNFLFCFLIHPKM